MIFGLFLPHYTVNKNSLKIVLSRFSAVVITGGSSGIGKSFIKAIISLNDRALLCNFSRTKPDIFKKNNEIIHFYCDFNITEELDSQCTNLIRLLTEKSGSGEILLINNSGFGTYGQFPDPDGETQMNMLAVNVRAPVYLTARLLPLLKERGGVILNVASTAAFQPLPFMATYAATKAFLVHWSLALNEDLKGTGVSTLALCPGPTETNFFARAGFTESPMSKYPGQTSEQVVDTALCALAKGKSLTVSGWDNRLLVFFSSKLPKLIITKLAAMVLRIARLEQLKKNK